MHVLHISLFVFLPILFTAEAGQLRCRQCDRAATLDDCTTQVVCNETSEECYMDELITEQLTVVYTGGCRAKDVCSGGLAFGKKSDLVACSRCCALDDCNKKMCGIRTLALNVSQCYSCNRLAGGTQSEVQDPKHCVTLTTCQADEVCFSQTDSVAGMNTFYSGCQRKALCKILMHQIFMQIDLCQTSPSSCHKRSATICNTCCADSGCNYGTCQEQNNRLYNLWKQGLFDMNTLKVLASPTSG